MASDTQELDRALDRLTGVLGGGATGRRREPTIEPGPRRTESDGGGPLTLAQREAIARQTMYSMVVPLLTPQRVAELEQSLPALIAMLRSLRSRPSLRRELQRVIVQARRRASGGERDEAEEARLRALVSLMQRDLPASGERVAMLIPIAFALGYVLGSARSAY